MNKEEIVKLSLEVDELTRQYRHDLHRIPELAFNEFKTASYIRSVLNSNDIPYSVIDTGTVVDIIHPNGTSLIAFRADIDALQIEEQTGLEFSSEHKGRMHACGHDCHTAMLLATTVVLWENKEKLNKNIRLIFQPAEESCGGARMMIDSGCLQGVSEIYCLHMISNRPIGKFVTKTGLIHASSDGFSIRVHGKTTHAASPHMGVDAIVISSEIILSLQKLISRETSAFDSAVLTIGKITGGKARNILCDEVVLEGTLRTLGNELRERLLNRIKAVTKSIAEANNGSADFEIVQSYCPCLNDEDKTQKAINIIKKLYGDDSVSIMERPSMGGEDFGYYEQIVPGSKLYIGTGCNESIHTSTFRVDEDTLRYGVGFFLAMALMD